MAATTGATRPYGAHERRRRRRRGRALPSAAATVSSTLLLRGVQRVGDVVARRGGRLLDGELAGQDLGQHRAENIAVLHVDPVLRSRNEPAAEGGLLVDLGRVQERGRVRDVPHGLQRL